MVLPQHPPSPPVILISQSICNYGKLLLLWSGRSARSPSAAHGTPYSALCLASVPGKSPHACSDQTLLQQDQSSPVHASSTCSAVSPRSFSSHYKSRPAPYFSQHQSATPPAPHSVLGPSCQRCQPGLWRTFEWQSHGQPSCRARYGSVDFGTLQQLGRICP